MTPYTGDDEKWSTSIELLDDADLATPAAALWNVLHEAVIDGLRYIASRVLTFSMSKANAWCFGQKVMITNPFENLGSYWEEYRPVAFAVGWLQHTVSDTGALAFEIYPPHAMAKLSGMTVLLDGKAGAGHVGGLPEILPKVWLYRITDGAESPVDSWTDPSATVGAYDQKHLLKCPDFPDCDPLDYGQRLFVCVTGEDGTHAIADTLALLDITCHWTSLDAVP